MPVQLRFMTAIVCKDAIAKYFPGGTQSFEERFLPALQDDFLYGLCSMSSSELGEIVESLRLAGFDTARFVAIGDMWAGPFKEVAGIVFESIVTNTRMPQWVARCAE